MSSSTIQSFDVIKKVANLPLRPGVYQFFDAQKHVLYIGKATSLRSRVQSYFRDSTDLSDAKRRMVHQIVDIEVIVVDTETEALLLETILIKQHKPPYNIVMKDDKNFQYIHITDDPYPRIETTRRTIRIEHGRCFKLRGQFFGPYTSGLAVTRTLKLLQKIFHFCSTPPILKRGTVIFPKRPCLEYQMNRCIGPCARAISPRAYQRVMQNVAKFLEGEYMPVKTYLHHEMQRAAKIQQYERAAIFRDHAYAINRMMVEQKVISTKREHADYVSLARAQSMAAMNVFTVRNGRLIGREIFFLQHTREWSDAEIFHAFCDQYYAQIMTKPQYVYTSIETRRGRHRKLLSMGIANAEYALQNVKNTWEASEKKAMQGMRELTAALGLNDHPVSRVEIYDISHGHGQHTVGSMVVFVDGQPQPSLYRKFIIKHVRGIDDFAALREVIDRRVRHLPSHTKTNIWPQPDLVIIDGGKGQLSTVQNVLDVYKLYIPIASLAKREEELFLPHQSQSIRLSKESAGLHLVQHMRDEAHRFAVGFYRRRHLKALLLNTFIQK